MHGVITHVTETPEITASARTAFAVMLRELRVPQDCCMRLNLKGRGSLFLSLDQPGALDQTFKHDGRTVLTIDKDTFASCEGLVLDYGQDERFVLRQSTEKSHGGLFPESWPPEFAHPGFREE